MVMPHLLKRLLFLLLIFPMAACHAETERFKAGEDYEILPQAIRTANPQKIEVNEVFHYGCIHCYNFEMKISPWAKSLGDDVDFQRTPAIWQSALEPYARAYFTANALKVLENTHTPLFEALHIKKRSIRSQQDLANFFSERGVDSKKFNNVYSSFGVTSLVGQAKARMKGYRTQGTPEMIVNGKYRVTTRMSKGFDGMLQVATFLIEKERQAKL
jgi:thiol:disulfide interchange protein DsbA